MDKTLKLLSQMEDVAEGIKDGASDASYSLEEAMSEYDRLSCEDDFLTGPWDVGEYLAEDMGAGVEAADAYAEEARDRIADMDKALMKLIQLRGKLAEETGIPIGGKQWVRLETYGV